jgi:hypothetical protein
VQKIGSICHIVPHTKTWQANAWIQGSQGLVWFYEFEQDPKMHWTNMMAWAMVQHMHHIVLEATKATIGVTWYMWFTYDEVITIDN